MTDFQEEIPFEILRQLRMAPEGITPDRPETIYDRRIAGADFYGWALYQKNDAANGSKTATAGASK